MKLAGAFGGGLARRGELCGAVSGALMVLGLRYGGSPIGDATLKEEIYQRAQAFIQAFAACHGSVLCGELLGVDIGTPEGRQAAKAQGLTEARCARYVHTATEMVSVHAVGVAISQ